MGHRWKEEDFEGDEEMQTTSIYAGTSIINLKTNEALFRITIEIAIPTLEEAVAFVDILVRDREMKQVQSMLNYNRMNYVVTPEL